MENKNLKNNFTHPAVIITILILVFLGIYLFFIKNSNSPQENAVNPQQSEIDALRKTVDDLKNQKPQTIVKEVPAKSGPDLASIISEWRDRAAFLICNGVNSYTGQAYAQTATAYIHRFADGKVRAITNRHALLGDDGKIVNSCEIAIPGDPNSIFVSSANMNLHPDPSVDAGQLFLDNTDPYISSLTKKKVCFQQADVKVNTGDQLIILGYPAIGSPTDITATEGIISGYDYPYYVTSAKIDHGNSGGLAILVKGDCYLGIPTGSVVGSIESLGRILEASVIQSTAQNK